MEAPPLKTTIIAYLTTGLIPVEDRHDPGDSLRHVWYLIPSWYTDNKTSLPKIPPMLFTLEGEQPYVEQIQWEIQRYKWATTHRPITLWTDLDSWVYYVEIRTVQDKAETPVREFRRYPPDHPLWVKLSLAWTCHDWYIQAREELQEIKAPLDVLPTGSPYSNRVFGNALLFKIKKVEQIEKTLMPQDPAEKPFHFGKRPKK